MLTEALTTAETLRLISSSALTRSRSEWSMMAISPGLSRLVMLFVRRSTRATARMPAGSPARPRNTGGITDGNFIESILPEPVNCDGHVGAHGVSYILRLIVTIGHAWWCCSGSRVCQTHRVRSEIVTKGARF